MANPFTPPAESPDGDVSPGETTSPEDDAWSEAAGLIIGMRFPQLLFGGLYTLMSLAILAVGALIFLGALSAGPDERLMMMGGSISYLLMGALGLIPPGLLVRSGLAALLASSADDHEQREHLLTSLRSQLWFWRVLALYLLLMTLLYGAGFFLLVGLGVMGNLG